MPTWLVVLLLALAVVAVLDRALLAAERRGWVYYRRSPEKRRAALGTALLQVMSIYQPAHEHVVDERRRADADEAGDDEPLAP